MSAALPLATRPQPPTRWEQVSLAIRAEDLDILRRWAVEEDRPVELHMARLLRLAALKHAGESAQNEAADGR